MDVSGTGTFLPRLRLELLENDSNVYSLKATHQRART